MLSLLTVVAVVTVVTSGQTSAAVVTKPHGATVASRPVLERPAQQQTYRGHLKTKAVNGSLICETPECSMAASLILSSMDVSVDPCEDFYMYSCGNFIAENKPDASTFDAAVELLDKRLLLLLKSPAKPSDPAPLYMLRRSFQACVDTDKMDSLGLTPLWDAMSSMGGMPMVDDQWDPASYSVEGSLVSIRDMNYAPMMGMAMAADIVNTSRKIIYIGTGTTSINIGILALPHINTQVIAAYKTYMRDAAKQLRDSLGSPVTNLQIATDVEHVVQFETNLARLMLNTQPQTANDSLELVTLAELQAIADTFTPGSLDYLSYVRQVFTGSNVIINADEEVYLAGGSEYISGLSTLLAGTPPRTLANFMGWMWVLHIGSETTYRMREISDTFLSNYYVGYTPPDRTYFCTMEANANLGFPMSRAYLDDFFPEHARAETEELVGNIRKSFNFLIDERVWLTDEDKVTAHEKLDYVEQFVAYPDWIMDDAQLTAAYEGLELTADEQFNNLIRLGQYNEFWDCEGYRLEPRSTFVMPPTVVNAFYMPTANSITILAGILQIPFYQHNSLAALNYGGIGMVIGHELTHGFDNSGRNYDKMGNLALWWSQESIDAFNDRAQCFIDQYNSFHPPEVSDSSVTVDGQQTLGENIADNGGLREAFQAYQIYVETYGQEPRLPGLDEYTSEQLFYLGNANLWCESRSEQSIMGQLGGDPHSPGRFRILGPDSNDDEFSRVWNCPASSAMNRGADRCLLW